MLKHPSSEATAKDTAVYYDDDGLELYTVSHTLQDMNSNGIHKLPTNNPDVHIVLFGKPYSLETQSCSVTIHIYILSLLCLVKRKLLINIVLFRIPIFAIDLDICCLVLLLLK